jgi:hypothetical protein
LIPFNHCFFSSSYSLVLRLPMHVMGSSAENCDFDNSGFLRRCSTAVSLLFLRVGAVMHSGARMFFHRLFYLEKSWNRSDLLSWDFCTRDVSLAICVCDAESVATPISASQLIQRKKFPLLG